MPTISKDETLQYLKQFANYVVRETRKRAPRASGDLKRSIKSDVEVFQNSISVSIYAASYMKYQDRGVIGTVSGTSLGDYDSNHKFRYTDKRPPARCLRTWAKRKAGKFRYKGNKSAGFAIANHIFKHGIKPKRFFTTPFENAFKQLPDELIEAYGLDVENFMEFVLNESGTN